jgi:hypothetical protein
MAALEASVAAAQKTGDAKPKRTRRTTSGNGAKPKRRATAKK